MVKQGGARLGKDFAPPIILELTIMPSSKRMMAFIDGENLTFRYQEMLTKGFKPNTKVIHEQDVFVWHPNTIRTPIFNIIRVSYYTYAVGDDVCIKQLSNQLKSISYGYREDGSSYGGSVCLYPKIFKKFKRTAKRKGVDISITIDALIHTFRDSVDVIYLVTGDGDYLPLIEEVIRNGKQVYLAALSEGLNETLPTSVDKFFNLDDIYFQKPFPS